MMEVCGRALIKLMNRVLDGSTRGPWLGSVCVSEKEGVCV